ncbi:MAG: NFACT RNA binding domain-containing protein [Chryseolinea sp.]
MQNNFHFFRLLTPLLEKKLMDAVVSECFTQDKDELILRFETFSGTFFIRATFSSVFACLSFPENFHRARKNSTDLFPGIIGQRVARLHQYDFERSFSIVFTGGLSMVFKMHGNRANLLIIRDNVVEELFKKNLVSDLQVIPETLNRSVDWSYESFLANHAEAKKLFFTFGKVLWHYLANLRFFEMSSDLQWNMIQELFQDLEKPSYFITVIEGTLHFSLVRCGQIRNEYNNPLAALNEFYQSYVQSDVLAREHSVLLNAAKKDVLSLQTFHEKAQQRIKTLQSENSYKVWADLIMANMHLIIPGQERIVLPDFYHENKEIEIKLRRELSPQNNAGVYYSKSKKQQIEINKLLEMSEKKADELAKAKTLLEKIERAKDLKEIRAAASAMKPDRTDTTVETVPYHEFEHHGFRILVGKNAQGNDTMLKRFSHKDDLWLHAKDVTGSHVLIKYQSGKIFPKDVIERAAQLAGFNSKRKTESLCAIVVTPRKYVRKRKGDPVGAVVVEREEVILVDPRA